MTTLVFFLEEPSAKEMLKGVLPKIISDEVECQYVVFEGKQDLDKQLEKRLKGWNKPDCKFLVLRDQDFSECKNLKEDLLKKCVCAGKPDAKVRIACRELESFYLGDPEAVREGLELKKLGKGWNSSKQKDPDSIDYPYERLVGLTNKKYQKIAGSRAIGPYMNIDNNRSQSFAVLIDGIKDLLADVK